MNEVNKRPVSFVVMSTGHGTMIANQLDYHRMPSGYEYGVGLSLTRTSFFEPEEIALTIRLLRLRREHFGDGVVALDCGANIGVHSVEWGREMHGWGEVYSYEVQEPIFYALCGNLAINNCLNVHAQRIAVGAEAGFIDVPKLDYHRAGSFGSLELRVRETTEYLGQDVDYLPERCTRVPIIALDSQGFTRVDFLKIDVEGMEFEVLDGAKQLIEMHKPIVLLEYMKSDGDRMLQLFRGMGYATYQIGMNLLLIHLEDPSGIGIL